MVTGATRGLGRLVAGRFWESGHDLIIIARNNSDLNDVIVSLKADAGGPQNIYPFCFDLSKINKIPDLMSNIRESAGNPDIVVNNAAIQGPVGPVHTNNWDDWQACLDVCLLAPVKICQEVIPDMIKSGYGRIINISGGGATSPRPNFSSYATAKCGLVRFSETLAMELAASNITVNCVAPGAMNSGFTKKILNAGKAATGPKEHEIARSLMEDNPYNEIKAADLVYALTTDPYSGVTGKLISAVWDSWEKIPDKIAELSKSEVYTLRRVVLDDRNIRIL